MLAVVMQYLHLHDKHISELIFLGNIWIGVILAQPLKTDIHFHPDFLIDKTSQQPHNQQLIKIVAQKATNFTTIPVYLIMLKHPYLPGEE